MKRVRVAENAGRRKLIIHCGAPKTGSTSLQFFFADHRKDLEKDGVVFPVRFFNRGDVDPLHRLFVRMRVRGSHENALKKARQRLDELYEGGRFDTVLISNESLLGEPFVEGNQAFFPSHEFSVQALQRFCVGYDTQIVYFIRDFESYLPSYYVQDIRRGGYKSFGKFVQSIDEETLTWLPVVEALKSAFGQDNIHIFEHKSLVEKPDKTFRAAFGSLFPHLPQFDGAGYGRNKSVGGWVLPVYRGLNWLFAKLVPKTSHVRGRLLMRRFVFQPLAQIAPKKKQKVSAELAAGWQARFQADKASLGL